MPFHAILKEIRSRKPLVHCISNIVTANDCANLLLTIGASPMMAQAPEEMEEITAISSATVLNTGTPDAARFAACEICGVHANRLHRPVVLDPVGVGASSWRLVNVQHLLAAGHLRLNVALDAFIRHKRPSLKIKDLPCW